MYQKQHNENYQTNEPKAPPPAEMSLKYMAWDVKKVAESLTEMAKDIRGIRMAIEKGEF